MVSALQGLQRLESQLNRALIDAGAHVNPGQLNEELSEQQVKYEAHKPLAHASLVLSEVDLLA